MFYIGSMRSKSFFWSIFAVYAGIEEKRASAKPKLTKKRKMKSEK
jgi:hypothetical protein